jgi:hypothetical protein
MCLVVIFAIYEIIFGTGNEPKLFLILWILGAVYGIFSFIRMPYKITIENEALTFKSIFSERTIEINSLKMIKTNINNFLIFFKHTDGKISMLNRINGNHDLITEIKNKNPQIIIKGC